MLKAINDCRILHTRHLELLFFTSPKPAYKRLAKLFHHEYLERLFITQVARAPASSPIVYAITKLGAAVLVDRYGYTPEQFRFPTRAVSDPEKIQHILLVADVWSAMMKACIDTGIQVVEWRDELVFRSSPDMVKVEQRGKPKPVLPDGYFHLDTPRGQTRMFLEVDSGVEGLQQVKSQMQVYQQYIASGAYEAQFKAKSLRVLIVTKSNQRIQSLARVIAEVGGEDRYWLTTFEEATADQMLTAPIWVKVGSNDKAALI